MSEQEPVTLYISRQIKPGMEEAIMRWQKEIQAACQQFPGYIGSRVLESHEQAGNTEDAKRSYDVVVRFATFEDLQRWEQSPEKHACYEKLRPLIESQKMSRMNGFEPWFPSPSGPGAPPRWKMCLMAFMAVYPIVLVMRLTLGPLLSEEHYPLPIAVFIMSIPTSLLMSYVAMPGLTRLFRKWLYPGV